MPKIQTRYVCSQCATSHAKWAGRCSNCGAWNTLEEVASRAENVAGVAAAEPVTATSVNQLVAQPHHRLATGSSEADRVFGGGIVAGSICLLGGEPGIGKSTLLLQLAGRIASTRPTLYISGEESAEQISLRAKRLGIAQPQLLVAATSQIEQVVATIVAQQPALVVVDSVQTMSSHQYSSAAGSITQVREAAARLQVVAKEQGIPVVLVGHVTKEGEIAGPKVLEHLVDVVLYLEGERFHDFRLLRGAKNRFGPTDEVGVFRMEEGGLVDVTNPAAAFLDSRASDAAGTAVTATVEGTRALLLEVQALAVPSSFGYPKRTAGGIDLNKLQLLIAVLTKHGGLRLGESDLYGNVSNGYRLQEPAADLAVAMAVASAFINQSLPATTVVIGEVGLSGEVRPVRLLDKRLAEAARSGFTRAVVPKQPHGKTPTGLQVVSVGTVAEALSALLTKQRQETASAA